MSTVFAPEERHVYSSPLRWERALRRSAMCSRAPHVAPNGAKHCLVVVAINMLLLRSKVGEQSCGIKDWTGVGGRT